jgi:hypothetical protein
MSSSRKFVEKLGLQQSICKTKGRQIINCVSESRDDALGQANRLCQKLACSEKLTWERKKEEEQHDTRYEVL